MNCKVFSRCVMALATGFLLQPLAASAQAASQTTSLVVPYAAGGTADIVARKLAEVHRSLFGTVIVIENKAGAGATLGTAQVARANPDGRTLLLASTSALTISPHLSRVTYAPLEDLTPIVSVAVGPVAVVATSTAPTDNWPKLMEYAKQHPGALRFGTPGNGSVAHLAMEAVMEAAGVSMLHVPYRGNSQALNDGLGGVVELLVVNSDVVLPSVRSGALRPVAVMEPQRLAVWPEVPTMVELGITDAVYRSDFSVFAPSALPAAEQTALVRAWQKATEDPSFKQLLEQSFLLPGSGSGQALADQIRNEYTRNEQIIRTKGISAN